MTRNSPTPTPISGHRTKRSPLFQHIGAALKAVYGTDLHLQIQAERDSANAAIERMSEEADKLRKQVVLPSLPIKHVEDALEAIVEDL